MDKEVSIVFNNEIKNQNKLKEYTEQLKTIKAFASALDKKTIADINVAASNIKNVGTKMNTAFNLLGAREFTRTMSRLVKTMASFVSKSSDYLENINLYQVAFDGNYKSADRFIKKMSEMYGLDESWLTRTVGIFRQLSNAMNLSSESGEKLATLMSQMSLDISSLYNIDIDRASSVLQSALAGQTKPIRGATGADITQTTLQTTLSNLGIDRAIDQLSYAEKRLVIIISLTQQLRASIGDMGRTIESPANQTRVLKEQWERLTRTIGSAFMPVIAKILPYLNAVLMALTEIVKLIASLFGYKVEDFDYFTGISDSVLDLEDSLGGATSGAKDLKKALSGLRGFDKLNVITTPSKASGGVSGGAGGTGISGDILKAFNDAYDEYQKKLEKIRMKAADIKDSIMRTLGFHRELNKETGEWEWKYGGIGATIKGLWNLFKKLNGVTKAFIALGLATVIAKLFTLFKKLSGVFTGGILKSMTSLVKSMGTFATTAIKSTGGLKNLTEGLKMGIQSWREQEGIIDKTTGKLNGFQGVVAGTKNVLLGLTEAYAGINVFKEGIKDLIVEGNSLKNTFETAGGAILTIFGGVQAGAVFGPWGAAVGGAASAVGLLIGALEGAKEAQNRYNIEMEKSLESSKIAYDARMEEVILAETYTEKLNDVINADGTVKKGKEEQAEFILGELSDALGQEYKLQDGIVYINGKVAGSLNDIKIKTKEYIEQLKLQAYVEAYKDSYVKALQQQAEKQAKLNELDKEYERQKKLINDSDKLSADQKAKALDELKIKYNNLKQDVESKYSKSSQVVKDYESMVKAASEGNIKEATKYFDKIATASTKGLDEEAKKISSFATDVENKSKGMAVSGLNYATQWAEGVGKLQPEINVDYKLPKPASIQDAVTKSLKDTKGTVNIEYKIKGGSGTTTTAKADGGIFVNGSWLPITNYAVGGIPPVGQMFVAREKGPELVGKIGSHTAVMNNDQIVSSVSNGVYNAVRTAIGGSQSSNQVFNIYLDENHKLGTYTLEQLQGMAKTNGKPISIGY